MGAKLYNELIIGLSKTESLKQYEISIINMEYLYHHTTRFVQENHLKG